MKKFKLLFAVLLLPIFMLGQTDYLKLVRDRQKEAEAARDSAIVRTNRAKTYAKAGNCDAAREAGYYAGMAYRDAFMASRSAKELHDRYNGGDSNSAAAVAAAAAAAAAAEDAAKDANAAVADGCKDNPQEPDFVKQTKDAQALAEAKRNEAVNQKNIAIAKANAGDCAAASAAAAAAEAADEAAKAAAAETGAAAETAALTGGAQAVTGAAKAAFSASEGAEAAAAAARAAADGCIDKPQETHTGNKKLTATPTGGIALAAAQSSADVGYCYHKDGVKEVPANSTITPKIELGMKIQRRLKEGLLGSLERPRSPYASFASYRPSAPAPALPPVQGGSLDMMSLNLGVSYLHLKGEDRHPERGASFDKKMVEVLATGDFYFINLLRAKRATSSPKVSPFVRLGAGFGIGNPNTVKGDKGDRKANFALPMGLGFRVMVTDKMALNLDYTARATFSDALDGITGSAENNHDDWYGAGGIGLSFALGKKANDSDGDGFKNDDDACPTVAGTLGGCPDSDGDGIGDKEDTCPNEAGDQRFGGCPDTDGDGVANNLDDCPDIAGLRRFSGCPDTDGDNIIDKEDKCPTVAGLVATNGCPDADKDGVNDDKDECPNSPGPAEQKGCPDTDDDGIVDSKDECPEVFGLGKFNGCPDTDNDGVADNKDACPNLKGPESNKGCPVIDATDLAVLDKAMRNVRFRTGSAELLPSSIKYLDQIAEVMSRYKGFRLSIDGYTDNQGPAASNQSLSEARAGACYEYLSGIGVKLSLMTYKGHGPTNPIGDNNTAEGRVLNRRVEFTLIPQ